MPGDGPSAGAPNVGGVSSVSGGASVGGGVPGGAPSAGAPNVSGVGSVSGDLGGASGAGSVGASGGAGGGAAGDFSATAGQSSVRDASNQVGRTTGLAGEESVGAQIHAPLGTTGEVIASGGGGGYVDTEVGSSEYDVRNKGGAALHGEALSQRDAGQGIRDGAIEQSGYQDPRVTVGMAETAELESRDGRMGQVAAAQDRAGDVKVAVANPVGAATSEAKYAATGEAQAHVPTAGKTAQADVNVVRDASNNPEAAGEGQVDLKVQQAELEQESKLGVHGNVGVSGSASTDPEKK